MDEQTANRVEGERHVELFVSSRTGELIRVPCWCALGRNHTYQQWVSGGRPDTSGQPAGDIRA